MFLRYLRGVKSTERINKVYFMFRHHSGDFIYLFWYFNLSGRILDYDLIFLKVIEKTLDDGYYLRH